MGRPSDARERLIRAATDLIWVDGYAALTVDGVCERADVRKGSFYHFFESKERLVLAALDAHWARRRPALDALFSPSQPPLERLRRYFASVLERQLDHQARTGHLLGCFFNAVAVGAFALAFVAVLIFFASRNAALAHEQAARKAELASGPRVQVTQAKMSSARRALDLQGEARAFASVTLYAKVSGYLRDVRVDKGDAVKANQVLAVIESLELDRQYDAALADARYKQANARRARALREPGIVSAQDADVLEGQAEVAEATLQAVAQQKNYEMLRAPFDGVVTARFADPGALVQNAANAQTGALPLVTVSQTRRLRVFVYVDQRDAAAVHLGDAAQVSVPGTPVTVDAKVSRRSDELDPRSRTMLVEVDVDNADGRIVAGSFVDVRLQLSTPPLVEVPASAVLQRNHKPFVAVVKDGRVSYQPVEVAAHDGEVVRLASGLENGTTVALNLVQVEDGSPVQAVTEQARR